MLRKGTRSAANHTPSGRRRTGTDQRRRSWRARYGSPSSSTPTAASEGRSAPPGAPGFPANGQALPVRILEKRDEKLARSPERLAQLSRRVLTLLGHECVQTVEQRLQRRLRIEASGLHLDHLAGALE